jgi:hypothetical protein
MRMIGNKQLETVTATCGHAQMVSIPPHAMGARPGPVGQQRIAVAQARPCNYCANGVEVVGVCVGCNSVISAEFAEKHPPIEINGGMCHTLTKCQALAERKGAVA